MTVILDAVFEKGAVRLVEMPSSGLAEGQHVRVIVDTDDDDSERVDWLRLSAMGLERAYGEDEPEYGLDTLREVNPDYRGR